MQNFSSALRELREDVSKLHASNASSLDTSISSGPDKGIDEVSVHYSDLIPTAISFYGVRK
jgi:hypothetical protein